MTDLDKSGASSGPSVPPRKGAGRKAGSAPFSAGAPRAARPAPKGQQASFRARKRRRQQLIGGGIVGAVIVVVAVLVAVGLGSSSSSGPTGAVSSATLQSITSISPSQMSSANGQLKAANPPVALPASASGGSGVGLTSGGRPEVLYMGAEYCPYCAGERWSLVMALSQFGTFSNLHSITSTAQDSVASVPTFTFLGSTYTSPYINFTSVEEQTVSGATLQRPTAAQQALITKYDNPPYTTQQGGIPFIDYGGYSVQDGLGYSIDGKSDAPLSGQKFADVANQIANQSSSAAGAITAQAGVIISNICHIDGGKSINDDAACKAFPTPITQPPASH